MFKQLHTSQSSEIKRRIKWMTMIIIIIIIIIVIIIIHVQHEKVRANPNREINK